MTVCTTNTNNATNAITLKQCKIMKRITWTSLYYVTDDSTNGKE